MPKTATIQKSVGQTPLECIEAFRQHTGIPSSVPLAYAGRLDPMASGTLLVLIGDECKKLAQYTHLDKQYRIEVLFGIGTDTGDVLGIAETSPRTTVTAHDVTACVRTFVGTRTYEYPKFSSKTVQGKPLHQWTNEGRIDEIRIPTKEATVYAIACVGVRTMSSDEVLHYVQNKIETIPPVTDESKKIGADFRRVPIRARWDEIAHQHPHAVYTVATIVCTVSSGMYMRTLAGLMGEQLGTTALALSIHRTKIGHYYHLGPFGLLV